MKLRKSSPKQSSPKSQKLRRLLALAIAINIALVGGLTYAGFRLFNQSETEQPQTGLRQALGIKSADETYDTVRSTDYEFSVTYNKQAFKPIAFIVGPEGKSFEQVTGKDALQPDAYSLVYLYSNPQGSKEKVLNSIAELGISTNINKDFFERRSAEFGTGLSQLDMVERYYKPKDTPAKTYREISKQEVVMNGISYRKAVYEALDTKYIANTSRTEAYFTVQNNRPYAVQITAITERDAEFVDNLRSVIANIQYGKQALSAPSTYSVNSNSKGKLTTTDSSSSANLPEELIGDTALTVAAKNQPSTVRIGSNSCANLSLMLPNGQEYMKMQDACVVASGSGAFVSQDGYVSTNGHVVRFKTADLVLGYLTYALSEDEAQVKKYLGYLVLSGAMSEGKLNAILDGVKSQNIDAIMAFMYSAENISPNLIKATDEFSEYALQLANKPIRYSTDGAKTRLTYTDTVIPAKFVDANFDPNQGSQGSQSITDSKSSDVAILKAEGKDFPFVQLGSIDGLKKGDLITAIGFPAFVDGGLDTKLNYTVPSITQGYVRNIIFDSPEKTRKLVESNTPIAGGNSGGPAFVASGLMAGLNTYGNSACSDDECFGTESYFRDVADYKVLLEKNKITLSTNPSSGVSATWSKGVDSLIKEEYGAALADFQAAKQAYPALYLSDSLTSHAQAQLDLQKRNLYLKIGFVILAILLIAGIVMLVRLMKHLRRHKQEVASAAAPPQYAAPNPYTPQEPSLVPQQPPQVQQVPIQNIPSPQPAQGVIQPQIITPTQPQVPPVPPQNQTPPQS